VKGSCQLAAVILAAGRGKRMVSDLPKVLHEVGGRPMIHWVVDNALAAGVDPIVVVVGQGKDQVMESLSYATLKYAIQEHPLGTGHAVEQSRSILENFEGGILVLSGDVPGIKSDTIRHLCQRHQETGAKATMLTAEVTDPTGYGRVLRDEAGHLLRVVEEKDASAEERSIHEINGGIYIFDASILFETLPKVKDDNKQKEYYLPDVLYILREQNEIVAIEKAKDYREILGINTKQELSRIHAELFQ
jgi:bifunctional UDP-N-acetylglucosamine pyrophosphorylase/glucosamine-1-phosphate N-acetyltransferase